MRNVLLALVAGLTTALVAFSPVGAQPFDPRSFQAGVARPTEVLVIGTPHLSGTPDSFDPTVLEPVLERLRAFAPDVIAIENLSGEALHAARAYKGIYRDTAKDYGGRAFRLAAMAQAETGLDLPAAEAAARAAVAALPAAPAPAERRRLAALFAAAGVPHSALVQWWRLEKPDRRAGDGVSGELAAALDAYDVRRNESHLIAVRLAARLGHERVYPMDDQSAVDLIYARLDEVMAYLSSPEAGERLEAPAFKRLAAAHERTTTPDETLAMYREINTAGSGRLDAETQWRSLAEGPDIARRRLAEWEVRNLRMAANIREAAAEAPGGRVLVIVGSAHKPWLDAYLGMMSDLRVVDAADVLR